MKAFRTVAPSTELASPEDDALMIVTEGCGVHWYGTRAQLEAAAGVPAGVEWRSRACGYGGGFEWRLGVGYALPNGRTRAPGVDGVDGDRWDVCRTYVPCDHLNGDVVVAQRALDRALWRRSPAGEANREAALRAGTDRGFCAFLDGLTAKTKRARAKRKADGSRGPKEG